MRLLRNILLVVAVAAATTQNGTAQGRDLQAIMKDLDFVMAQLRTAALRTEDTKEMALHAGRLDVLLVETESFYGRDKKSGAIGVARDAVIAVRRVVKAAEANNIVGARVATGELWETCRTCHMAYREERPVTQREPDGIEILTVRRARAYAIGPAELRPTSHDEVVLVVTVRGIPDQQWNAGQIYLTSGQLRINLTRRMRVAEVDERVAVFIAPLSTTKFMLHVEGQASVPFEATDAVVDHVMVR